VARSHGTYVAQPPGGLFVPKPTTDADCSGCGLFDLRTTVRQRSLAAGRGGSDRYLLGYAVALLRGGGLGPKLPIDQPLT